MLAESQKAMDYAIIGLKNTFFDDIMIVSTGSKDKP